MAEPFVPKTLYDAINEMGGGVNAGDTPLDLPANVMAGAINTTVTGKQVTHRPGYANRIVTYPNDGGVTKARVQQGIFQGCTENICLDDAGNASIIALISGRVFQFSISGNTVACAELPIYQAGVGGVLQTGGSVAGGTVSGPTPGQPQAWLWQSELWVLIEDGFNNPIVVNLNGNTSSPPSFGNPNPGNAVRSAYGGVSKYSTTIGAAGFGVSPIGGLNNGTLASVANLTVNQVITLGGLGQMQVQSISGLNVVLVNLSVGPGTSIPPGWPVYFTVIATGLPPGRMGAYGMGRNWLALTVANQFIALDIVNGSSGTQPFNFRDSVLQSTENTFIVGGGTFCIPGNAGAITAMKFTAQENVALGQGPLLVFSHKSVYSCQSPVDRLTWQSVTNPILTEAIISNGAKGQWSTVVAQSDMTFRAVDGIRSWTLDQQNFSRWSNPPCSFEVSPVLALDNQALLNFGSAIVFGNRRLETVGPVQSSQGVYFTGLTVLNFSPISSLKGSAPAVWDAETWVGSGATSQMQIMQMTSGEVASVERAFALVLNTTASPNQIEFWEILADGAAIADNDGTNNIPIPWQFDSASLRFKIPKDQHVAMNLTNGDIEVDELIGTVTISAFYKQDQYPVFTPWRAWQTCSTQDAANSQPAFLPRQGLGEPSPSPFDPSTNRPMRNGFTFQFRLVVVGHLVFLGAFFEAQTTPMRKFAPIVTKPLC